MGYMDEHDSLWWQNNNNPYFKKENVDKWARANARYPVLEELNVEVKAFVEMSSLLVGADKIRAILKKLETLPR